MAIGSNKKFVLLHTFFVPPPVAKPTTTTTTTTNTVTTPLPATPATAKHPSTHLIIDPSLPPPYWTSYPAPVLTLLTSALRFLSRVSSLEASLRGVLSAPPSALRTRRLRRAREKLAEKVLAFSDTAEERIGRIVLALRQLQGKGVLQMMAAMEMEMQMQMEMKTEMGEMGEMGEMAEMAETAETAETGDARNVDKRAQSDVRRIEHLVETRLRQAWTAYERWRESEGLVVYRPAAADADEDDDAAAAAAAAAGGGRGRYLIG